MEINTDQTAWQDDDLGLRPKRGNEMLETIGILTCLVISALFAWVMSLLGLAFWPLFLAYAVISVIGFIGGYILSARA